MEITLSADVSQQLAREVASGGYARPEQLIEEAIRYFLDDRNRGQRGLEALRKLGDAVDEAGLYERVLVPAGE